MKQRTIVEMMLSTCPNCGETNHGATDTCPRCGSRMTVQESILRELDEGIMPETEESEYPTIQSYDIPVEHKTITARVYIILFYFMLLFIFFSAFFLFRFGNENDSLKEAILPEIISFSILSLVSLLLYFKEIRNTVHYHLICNTGTQYRGTIVNYMTISVPKSGSAYRITITSEDFLVARVYAEINHRGTIVELRAPDGMSELSHPPRTPVTLIGRENHYFITD